ncbi:hypothetical protein GJAV_G00168170 [Gymnothorax javanicus]|nr:hypothetical protein GJAV_G00168170 [Gymnothorax javanicus]
MYSLCLRGHLPESKDMHIRLTGDSKLSVGMKTGESACWCLILLMYHLISVSRQETLQIVGASGPIIASVGEDVTLPCSLQPSRSTKIVYVQWFRPQNRDPLVHLHDQGEDSNQNQNPSYNERTGLLSEDLTNGIASLRLRDVQVTDKGEYQCLIQKPSDPHGYFQTLVSLEIRAVGTEPVIFTEAHRQRGVGLMCESKGWYPQPDLIWHDSEGHKLSFEKTEVFRDSRDLFTVRRHVVLHNRGTRRVFCRVFQQKLHQDKVMEFEIHAEMFCQKPWIIFAVILAVLLIAFSIFIRHLASLHKRKGNPYDQSHIVRD